MDPSVSVTFDPTFSLPYFTSFGERLWDGIGKEKGFLDEVSLITFSNALGFFVSLGALLIFFFGGSSDSLPKGRGMQSDNSTGGRRCAVEEIFAFEGTSLIFFTASA